ncbi:MAG TPA: hypothetical protein DEF51_31915 [Myxococcales bacterium]|nr:hypothetical protein [Myxococcales bacterium]
MHQATLSQQASADHRGDLGALHRTQLLQRGVVISADGERVGVVLPDRGQRRHLRDAWLLGARQERGQVLRADRVIVRAPGLLRRGQ